MMLSTRCHLKVLFDIHSNSSSNIILEGDVLIFVVMACIFFHILFGI